jgi:hypothetical protein
MKYAIQIFGQFRSAQKVFDENIQNLRNILGNDAEIDVFILSQKGNYFEQNEQYIRGILANYNMNIIFYEYVENYIDELQEENVVQEKYNKIVLPLEHHTGYDHFVCKLWYRRWFLNQLFHRNTDKQYDYVIHCRLFDVVFKKLREFDFLTPNNHSALYFSHDTFFLGSQQSVDKLLEFGKNMADNLSMEQEIWSNPKFSQLYHKYDSCLYRYKATYCSETQICWYIFKNFQHFLNLRYDFNSTIPIEKSDAYLYVMIQR